MNRLREFRLRANITLTQLAKRSGVSLPALSKIELWQEYPQTETQIKIAAVFCVKPKIIFDKPSLPRKQLIPRTISSLSPVSYQSPKRYQAIHCRWCHESIVGLGWNAEKSEFLISRMPRLAKVHNNGFFYHENCLSEKLRSETAFPRLINK